MGQLLFQSGGFFDALGRVVWGAPMALLLLGTGLYLSCRLGWVQLRHFGEAMRGTVGRMFSPVSRCPGAVTPFQAMSTALAGTMGTGNIAGVALAVSLGGPGALFWLWATALLGMATKYSEVLLAVRYRERNSRGEWAGGPMYYIKNGLGRRARPLAALFALAGSLAALGMGDAVQVGEMSAAVRSALELISPGGGLDLPASVAVGGIASGAAALVLLGGARRLGAVAELLVPAMSLVYALACLAVIGSNLGRLPGVLELIFRGAFEPRSVAAGLSLRACLGWGLRRGVFSNEAGLGSAPIAHASTSETEPVRQGFYGIFEVFADTMVVCTLTGVTLLISGVGIDYGSPASTALCAGALGTVLGRGGGALVIAVGMCFFALSTLLSWGLYGARCCEFLLGARSVRPYLALFSAVAFLGAVMDLDLAWALSDVLNGLMALPNLFALLALSPVVERETASYFRRKGAKKTVDNCRTMS